MEVRDVVVSADGAFHSGGLCLFKINFRPNSQLLTEMSREVKRLLLRSLPQTHQLLLVRIFRSNLQKFFL